MTHVAHHRISLLLGEFSGFSFEAQYAVAYVAEVPEGSPQLLAPTVRPGRESRFWLILFEAVRTPLLHSQPSGGCSWAHPPMSKINLRLHSPPRTQTGKGNSF